MIESPHPKKPAINITFNPPGPVIQDFLNSKDFVRGIMGPIGSGKSSACVVEILRRAHEQKPSPDGVRRSRWAIIRNSYPELKTTTLKTWTEWCPRDYGKLTMDSPITHRVVNDGLDMEVLFIALDRDEDVKKLLSLELTGAWINEAREIPKAILDALTGRVGRYPSKNMGGASWSGIMLDTNPPDDQSWWYRLAEDEVPDGWKFFRQPGGNSSDAENVPNLPLDYYKRISAGKDPEWINIYVHGNYGYLIEGKVVYPMFRDSIHVSPSHLEPVEDIALTVGADATGLRPAAIIGQLLPNGQWRIIDEFTTDNCGITRFSENLAKYVKSTYPNHMVAHAWCDPAALARDGDERVGLDVFREKTGWKTKPAPTNELAMRIEVVIAALNRMVEGGPGIIISSKCKMLRKGFSSGYHYKSVRTGNGTQFHDTPAKNEYSDPHDGLQYLLLGGGEADVVMNRVRRKKEQGPRIAKDLDYSIYGD